MNNSNRFYRGLTTLTVVAILTGIAAFGPRPAGAGGRHSHWHSDDSRYTVKEDETIRKSFTLTGEHPLADVDNVFGSIEVVGTSGNTVEMVVVKTIRAESKDDLELAKKEVTLDVTEKEGGVKMYVNGPFRCQCNDRCGSCRRDEGHRGYVVEMNFQLRVPANANLRLRTVNDGDIDVKGVGGDFQLDNVNGGIHVEDAAGSGRAKTINGDVRVTFRVNPTQNSEFSSLNGAVELYFVKGLSADFRFKTFNGGVYTDFELTSLPQRGTTQESKNGKYVYKTDRYTGGRIGAGGPEIKVENFNGDIKVLERHV